MLRTLSGRLLSKYHGNPIIQRFLSHYPIDETIFGLNEDQIKVLILSANKCDVIVDFLHVLFTVT